MESSQFTDSQPSFESLEPLNTQGATCDTFRVKLYGKLHFLKRLKPEFANDIRYQEAFRKEFETGYRLEHPNLVRYISLTGDGILMEYIDGETLTQYLANHPDYFKSKQNTQKFLRQLLDVVGYLHSHQVLHLDLKPENILLTRINNDVKLVDLGCCYTDTFTDTQGRTNRYAAPEQLSGEKPDARTDIYAIGKILERLPTSSIYNKVIARCTASAPSARYQSVAEILHDINHQKRYYRYVALFVAVVVTLFVASPLLNRQQDTAPTIQELQRDSIALPEENRGDESRDSVHQNQGPAPIIPKPSASNAVSDIEDIRKDIQKSILPKFTATVGALPDSVMPGSEKWAEASREFEPMITQSLREIIESHQSVPMEIVAKEFNDYVQSLLTLKMNQAKKTADD